MHKCELCESDKMQDLIVDVAKRFYCRSCKNRVDYEDIHPSILKDFKLRRK